jgi:hypothetical protein
VNYIRTLGGIDALHRSRLLGQSDPRSQARYEHLVPRDLFEAKDQHAEGLRRYLGRRERVNGSPSVIGLFASSPERRITNDDRNLSPSEIMSV